MTSSLKKKVGRSLQRRGLLGTLRHAVTAVPRRLWALMPSGRRARLRAEELEREFDRAHGVDTGGAIDLADLDVPSPNWAYGAPYEPINPGLFRRVVEAAALDHTRFTFVDFGSGKGRALLLASEHPFHKVVGVEFAPGLVEIARRNLHSARGLARRCREVEIVCLDAARFPIPTGPVILFFNNPFEPEVMAPVAENVRRSLESHPRELFVLYAFPFHETLWSQVALLKKVHSEREYAIYRAGQ